MFPSNDSSGHVWCSSDRPSQNFQPEVGKNSAQNTIGNIEVVQTFFLKMFFWKYRKQIRQTWRWFNFKNPKSFGSNWENNDNLFFFKNSSFSQMILVDKNNSIPTDLFHLFSWNLESFLLKSDKKQKFSQYNVLKILLWRVRIQFWQPCRCFSAETTKTSRSMSQKTEKKTQLAFLKNLWFL